MVVTMTKRPNILLIMADQLRFDALGCYGNTGIHTPNIDSLALNGCIFDNQFIQNPVCSPSRCSMITGRYPRNHGTRDNGISLRDEEITLPEVLRNNGYETAAIGKMHFTTQFNPKENEEDDWPRDHYGFNVIHTSSDTKTGEYLQWLKEASEEDYKTVKMQGERKAREDRASAADKDLSGPPQVYPSNVRPEYHQSTWIASQTIDFISRHDENVPYFALCSFVDPHHPFDPPAPYSAMYDPDRLEPPVFREGELEDKPPHFMKHRTGRGYSNEKYDYRKLSRHEWGEIKAAYYGMISLIDYNVGRILAGIREKNKENNTIVLFTSDHGEMLGDHGLLFKGPFLYDCLIRAPLIISWPDQIQKGARISSLTEHVDIMPTILECAGIKAPYGVQGMSLLPLLQGDSGNCRDCTLTEFHCYDWGLNLKTIVTKEYKLTYYAGEQFGELYDRHQDPQEFVNLWNDEGYASVKQAMLKRLTDRIIETEDVIPRRTGKY